MSWFRLDDQGAFHQKVTDAGNEAYGAWCRGGQWSSGHRKNGFIPFSTAHTIGAKKLWDRLLLVRLCEPADGGYQIHDFLDWNPSADEVEAKRAARSAAGKRGGHAKQSGGKREAIELAIASHGATEEPSKTEANAKQNSAPSPSPSPSQCSSTNCIPGEPPGKRKARRRGPEIPIPSDWAPTNGHAKEAAEIGVDLQHQAKKFRLHAETHDRRCVRWDQAFSNWLLGATPSPAGSPLEPQPRLAPDAKPPPPRWRTPGRPAGTPDAPGGQDAPAAADDWPPDDGPPGLFSLADPKKVAS